jgi:hypothetical protein
MADTSNTTAALVRLHDPVQITERVAVVAFIAGYTGGTRVSYTTDLRIFAEWCHDSGFNLLNVRRPHLKMFARWMEQPRYVRALANSGPHGIAGTATRT